MKGIRSKFSECDFNFVSFAIGSVEFGIDVKYIKEVVRCGPILRCPGLPRFLEGFVKLRHLHIPVVDLRKRFSLDSETKEDARLLVASLGGRLVGFVVDSTSGITHGSRRSRLRPASVDWPHTDYVDGIVDVGQKRTVVILTPDSLLSEDELEALMLPYP
ncbi:MAG: chemotaxis protein CheW [Deltaproteobacteria bacterium]